MSSFATDQQQIDFHGTQFGCRTSRGAEIALHVFRNLIENEQNPENFILMMDFKNAFNSLKRDKMLDTVLRKRRKFHSYTHTAYCETSHIFFVEKIMQSEEGFQQEKPEVLSLFSYIIQDLVNQMASQYTVWNLDDKNFLDDYQSMFEDFKQIIATAKEYEISLEKKE